MESFSGGRWYQRTVANLQKEVEARLTDDQKTELADVLQPVKKPAPKVNNDPPVFVKAWTMADFDEAFEHPLDNRDIENGRKAFIKAQCAVCHIAAGIVPENNIGPDLTGIGSRFGTIDMMESIIHPSRVIGDKYRNPAGPNISLMPPGLINILDRESVLDLLAFMQAGEEKEE